ncbi:MAG: sulfatase-like hydrolase/transferase, partial [Mucilaginibacter polytrichastri]|nr:sulfatase-like hydrolase/transferase [Mucilaginibacter polytrichastri]
PYQYWKSESFEGGIHTPMIAFWPKGMAVKKGGYNKQVGHVMDFMPTLVELAGAKYPAEYKGRKIQPMSGISLAGTFSGKISMPDRQLFNEHYGARYARSGNWKLVSLSTDSAWKLYDLSTDRSETRDVAAKNPQKVKELKTAWHRWADTHSVFPKPGK